MTKPRSPSRFDLAAAVLVLLSTGPAGAQTPAPAPARPAAAPLPPLPRALAGYAQPAIPPSACQLVNAGEARCQLPGMIAGRYVIETTGTSTAQGAGAVQVLQIVVGDQVCGFGRDTGTWSSGPRTFRFDCAVTLLSDQPITVRVLYSDEKAVKDPRGPSVVIRPLAWNGLLNTLPFAPAQ